MKINHLILKNILRAGLALILVLIFKLSFSQDWNWQNPLPQGNALNCIKFADEQTGYAVGDQGIILKTTDSGLTWTILESGTFARLRSLYLVDVNTIIVVGGYYPADQNQEKSIILRSTDKGAHWTKYNPEQGGILENVIFTDEMQGYIVGPENTLLRTTNAGVSWSGVATGFPGFKSISFSDNNTAFAITGGNGIYKTTDNGNSWSLAYTNSNAELWSVYFTNPQEGFAIGRDWITLSGLILKTSDGGATWALKSDLSNVALSGLNSMDFVDENNGYAVGESGLILRTSDKGNTWTQMQGVENSWLYSVGHTNTSDQQLVLFAVGQRGTLLRSTDSGVSWVSMQEGSQQGLGGIQLLRLPGGRSVGFAAGAYSFLRKNPDQEKWEVVQNLMPGTVNSIHFTDSLTGFAFGLGMFRTEDAGETWTSVMEGFVDGVYFIDRQTGYAIKNGTILKTTSGGQDWTTIYSGEPFMNDIFFVESSYGKLTGYAVGGGMNQGIILKTTDGGVTWSSVNSPVNAPLRSVCFPDTLNGYAVGERCSVIRTRDGGQTWEVQNAGMPNMYDWLNSVSFSDANHGFIAGVGGLILKTIDGGGNWQQVNSGTENELLSIQMLSPDTAYAAGANGTILTTVNGGGTIGIQPSIKAVGRLRAYPNPSESMVKIILPTEWNIGEYILSNILGDVILSRKFSGSEIAINLKDLPSGIYQFAVVTAGGRDSIRLLRK